MFFNHYNHPAHESPEFQYTQHIIGITGSGHPMYSEHRFDGRLKTHYSQPGEVIFIPAQMNYSSIWEKIATSLNNIALLYDYQGRYDEAEPLYIKALQICKNILGTNHPKTKKTRKNLEDMQNKKNKKNPL
ncbi:MAG: tetratricopeptide repeat protein [Cyanobacteria bacterium J06643_5]